MFLMLKFRYFLFGNIFITDIKKTCNSHHSSSLHNGTNINGDLPRDL